jgi:hypothetical protein
MLYEIKPQVLKPISFRTSEWPTFTSSLTMIIESGTLQSILHSKYTLSFVSSYQLE